MMCGCLCIELNLLSRYAKVKAGTIDNRRTMRPLRRQARTVPEPPQGSHRSWLDMNFHHAGAGRRAFGVFGTQIFGDRSRRRIIVIFMGRPIRGYRESGQGHITYTRKGATDLPQARETWRSCCWLPLLAVRAKHLIRSHSRKERFGRFR